MTKVATKEEIGTEVKKPITKKNFKEECNFQLYTGGRRRINAIYFDWKSGDVDGKYFGGFKFTVRADVKNCGKTELFNSFFNWVNKGTEPAFYITYKYAATDQERFKVPLSLKD